MGEIWKLWKKLVDILGEDYSKRKYPFKEIIKENILKNIISKEDILQKKLLKKITFEEN